MLARLRSIDPEAAARLHPADEKRIVRALEVYEETGKTITQHNLETQAIPPRYRPVWLGLDYSDRAVLYRRIDLRVDKCWKTGCWTKFARCSPSASARRRPPCRPSAIKNFWILKRRVHAGRSRCALQAALAQLRQAAADLVPAQSGHSLAPADGHGRFFGGSFRRSTEYSFFRVLNMVRYGCQIIGEALMQWTRALEQSLPYKEKEPIPMQKQQRIIRTFF